MTQSRGEAHAVVGGAAASGRERDRRRWPRRLIIFAVAAALVGTLVSAERGAQASARTELATRFQLRATAAADFMAVYARSVLDRERLLATSRLNGPSVSDAAFASFREDFGFGPALLLDARGDDLLVVPPNPAVVGTDLTARYAHLDAAHHGVPAISNVVGSAASNAPIVAFAVPFATPNGPRVVSGGFDLRSTPLGLYLDHILPTGLGTSDLVDANGVPVVVGRAGGTAPDRRLLTAISTRSAGRYVSEAHTASFFATAPVVGTPWRVVLSSTTAALYRPASKASGNAAWLLIALIACIAALIAVEYIRSKEAKSRLEVVARRDALTGLPNRRELESRLEELAANASRYGEPLSLLMIDIDHFKIVNDTHGHPAGDVALRAVAGRIAASVRLGDVAGRWGGEEFMVALPRTDAGGAAFIAERIRFATAGLPVLSEPHAVSLTVSVGVATTWGENTSLLVKAADGALYQAKAGGRDQVVASSAHPATHT